MDIGFAAVMHSNKGNISNLTKEDPKYFLLKLVQMVHVLLWPSNFKQQFLNIFDNFAKKGKLWKVDENRVESSLVDFKEPFLLLFQRFNNGIFKRLLCSCQPPCGHLPPAVGVVTARTISWMGSPPEAAEGPARRSTMVDRARVGPRQREATHAMEASPEEGLRFHCFFFFLV
jgi:hypothetical protein